MNYCLYKLRFDAPVHFGPSDTALSLYSSEESFCADTLFSALCHSALSLGGTALVETLCQWVREGTLLLTDGLLWQGEQYYLPKPCWSGEFSPDVPTRQRKAMKALNWVPVSQFAAFTTALQGGAVYDALRQSEPGRHIEVERAKVGRWQEDTEPYYVGAFVFHEDAGLYILAGCGTDEQQTTVATLLDGLGWTGIGGKVSSGYGKFCVADAVALSAACTGDTRWLYDRLTDEQAPQQLLLTTSLPKEDEQAFLSMLVEKGLVDQYEDYVLSGYTDLYRFLHSTCGLNQNEIYGIAPRYLSAGNAMGQNGNKAQIHRFQRDNAGRAYIPGSSLKGALRTVWLAARILEEEDRSKRKFRQPNPYAKAGQLKKQPTNPIPEEDYVSLLHCNRNEKKRNDAVNSIFRGISISDSEPIPDSDFVLCRKWEVHTDGGDHGINLIRECVKPGTTIRFKVTLDQFFLNDRITAESLMEDIAVFVRFYREHYLSRFALPRNAIDPLNDRCILLGGGPGLFSKSLDYPYWGDDNALEDVSSFLNVFFSQHKHAEIDPDLGISPRMLKYTECDNRWYPFGVCQVSFQ